MYSKVIILALTSLAAASPSLYTRTTFTNGVATFNDYSTQSNTVCGPKTGSNGTWGAAAGDISPNISGGKCSGFQDSSKCSGSSGIGPGPSCPTGACGKCYTVTNMGGVDGASIGGVGNSITVQIIDACPSTHPQNYCPVINGGADSTQRCDSSSTNSLDIEVDAYSKLTNQAKTDGLPNLKIDITPTSCL